MNRVIIAIVVATALAGCSPMPAPLLEVSVDRSGDYGGGAGYYAVIDVENAGNCDAKATILTTINIEGGGSRTIENPVKSSPFSCRSPFQHLGAR